LPDRLGAPRALTGAAVVAGAGQAVAVPALGLLALAGVPEARRGGASGTFFAFFDVGVGAGGPLLGAVAAFGGAGAAIAAGAVASAASCAVLALPRGTS
jgi:hypothetical protein